MAEGFLGQIILFAGNFAPRNWALCNGQILSIAQNTALFSILGITYGGNGQTTFALPDLRGRAPISPGQGPGLSTYVAGQMGGEEMVTLNVEQMPRHVHQALASAEGGTSATPPNGVWAGSTARDSIYAATPDTTMNPQAIGPTGGNQPHDNRQPYVALNYIICIAGYYPSRN